MLKKGLFFIIIAFIGLLASACRPTGELSGRSDHTVDRLQTLIESSEPFKSHFTGFVLYDPAIGDTIYAFHDRLYFTPASNMKLFTFYTGLKMLPDQVPALRYVERGDSLIFWGTGDPSFLHEALRDHTVFHFLKNSSRRLYLSDPPGQDHGLGPGWAWDDYPYAYSAEKSPFPMYGNLVKFKRDDALLAEQASKTSDRYPGLTVTPSYVRSLLRDTSYTKSAGRRVVSRRFDENTFYYARNTSLQDQLPMHVPYHYTASLVAGMLSDTLGRAVSSIEEALPDDAQTIYSVPTDTLYKHMLQPSDNFIAEQLLLMAAAEQRQPLRSAWVISYMKEHYLDDIPDEPQWVDGSGLSRYNMVTPRSMIWLLGEIDAMVPTDEALFSLLPAGGVSGTLRGGYGARDGGPPYLFAKTGTLRHNHNLSGYLLTKRGHKLYFSFMNNHYVTSTAIIREAMEEVLWHIHLHY